MVNETQLLLIASKLAVSSPDLILRNMLPHTVKHRIPENFSILEKQFSHKFGIRSFIVNHEYWFCVSHSHLYLKGNVLMKMLCLYFQPDDRKITKSVI